MRLQVGRRRAGHQPLAGQLACNQMLGVVQAAEADQQVDAFLQRINEVIGEGHRQLQVRILLAHFQQHRQHHQPTERGRHVDAQAAARQMRRRTQARFSCRDFIQRRRARGVVRLAIGGQRDAPGGAMEQAHAQPCFQPGNGLADRRAGDAQRVGGLGEGGRARRGDEGHQAIQRFDGEHRQTRSLGTDSPAWREIYRLYAPACQLHHGAVAPLAPSPYRDD
ncbi:hypothetical protein D3C72_1243650 [compost metagenome]